MSIRIRPAAAVAAWLLIAGATAPSPRAQTATPSPTRAVRVAPSSISQLREWDQRVDSMLRRGDLRVNKRREDLVLQDRSHERAEQFHQGVRVFGGELSRQLRNGQVVSVFGTVYEGITIDADPSIDEERAIAIVREAAGGTPDPRDRPELTILPADGNGYKLTWRIRAVVGADIRQYFIDARTGEVVLDYTDVKTQAAGASIGRSTGVLGDEKKISVKPSGGQFVAEDPLRPPTLRTYDMKGDIQRVIGFLNGTVSLSPTLELATDADNNWTDGMAVDAHVYAGYTYDFYFKRYNRKGLNNADIRIVSLVHPARRQDVFTALGSDNLEFFVNAGYYGSGVMVYGVGLPPGVTLDGQSYDFLSGAIDIVGHELTHGITDYSSGLIYRNESGALNEAFSDIMGTAIEFAYQPAGSGNLRADYLMGEDVIRSNGIRSLSDPGAFGDPDHYSRRFTGSADNGGVHINSGIPNHAYYLAVEGGTNRTSGLAVQGVGAANRRQIEDVFYRAFTELLPANATFATARAATIQAARDLYGSNSAAERAVTQAWTAVGVN
jgi:bacillolysin